MLDENAVGSHRRLRRTVRLRREHEYRLAQPPPELADLPRLPPLRRLERGVDREEGAVRDFEVCDLGTEDETSKLRLRPYS